VAGPGSEPRDAAWSAAAARAVAPGAEVRASSVGRGDCREARSDIEVLDLPGLGLDEVLAGLDALAHQHREDGVGLGRVLQVATIQLDFNMPERFGLYCINEKSEKEPIVMIHCAIMGSIERFMATLIEHLAGNFPLWLSPTQVSVIPVRDEHAAKAQEVTSALEAASIRAKCDDSNGNMGKKVRAAKEQKIPYFIIIGDKDIEANKITLESRDKGPLGQFPLEEVLEKLQKEIKSKS